MTRLLLRTFYGLSLTLGLFLGVVLPAGQQELEGPQGHLLIVGGGDTPEIILTRFIDLAGGPGGARIAVLPMASGISDEEAQETVTELRALGAAAEVVALARPQAEQEAAGDLLAQYSGFWFSGGDQLRLLATLGGTPALAGIHRRYFDGAVVAGTSAGAAAMSRVMLAGLRHADTDEDLAGMPAVARGVVELSDGFGLLPGTIVDQHFLRRARHSRLLSAVLEHPDLIGLGIDESTAVLVRPDRQWEILGNSYVKVFDARRAQVAALDGARLGSSNIRMHLLPSRSLYDPRSGQTRLPAG